MDCEKLILLVQERKYLWDQRENNYHMRNVQQKLWKEVSTEMKLPEEAIKKRWRGLRDTFRKEFIKHMKHKADSGADTCQPPSWPFFRQLSFLGDTIKPRKIDSSLTSVESQDKVMVSVDFADNDSDEQLADADLSWNYHCEDNDSHQQTPTVSSAKRKCSSNNELSNFDEKLLELEKIRYFKQETTETQDDDYQFLMSLLPYLHDIPKERKLFVRQKMMGVLVEEFSQHTPATSTHSTPK